MSKNQTIYAVFVASFQLRLLTDVCDFHMKLIHTKTDQFLNFQMNGDSLTTEYDE